MGSKVSNSLLASSSFFLASSPSWGDVLRRVTISFPAEGGAYRSLFFLKREKLSLSLALRVERQHSQHCWQPGKLANEAGSASLSEWCQQAGVVSGVVGVEPLYPEDEKNDSNHNDSHHQSCHYPSYHWTHHTASRGT